MTLLFICIGIIAGGMLFHFPGAVSGGIIGRLCRRNDDAQKSTQKG
jgi:hypothetical protein